MTTCSCNYAGVWGGATEGVWGESGHHNSLQPPTDPLSLQHRARRALARATAQSRAPPLAHPLVSGAAAPSLPARRAQAARRAAEIVLATAPPAARAAVSARWFGSAAGTLPRPAGRPASARRRRQGPGVRFGRPVSA